MKIVEINMSVEGSTGRIMLQIADKARHNGHEVKTYSTHRFSIPYSKLPDPPDGHIYFGNYIENFIHFCFNRVFGFHGLFSWFGTISLINQLKKFKPDIVNLHNLHGSCICLPFLFNYLKKSNVVVVWTLQDCWAITGCCTHFVRANCMKWRSGCYNCPLYKEGYLKSLVDQSKLLWNIKRKIYSGFNKLYLIPTSKWLENHVSNSILKCYPTKVIYNGIDTKIFKPTESSFRDDYELNNKYVILGVSAVWDDRKGLDVFIELSKSLSKDKFAIVLVGTDKNVDNILPQNIISIHRTANQIELAKLYTMADVFVNPTKEDDFPTVNIEALACGTPVVAYDTGGCSEAIDENTGRIVEYNDVEYLIQTIEKDSQDRLFNREACRKRALLFDKDYRYSEYIDLYDQLMKGRPDNIL